MDNKRVFAANLQKYMKRHNKKRSELSAELGIKYTTLNEWYNGKKYPRIEHIEQLAEYFGINKSELIEEASTSTVDGVKQELVNRLMEDDEFLRTVVALHKLDREKLNAVYGILITLYE